MITVFGGINLDIVMPVARLPRPGETTAGESYALLPGGKGANQALAARRAGAEVAFVGRIGDDDFGRMAIAPLADAGIDLSGLERGAQPTGCAAVCVDAAGENQIAVAAGANWHVEAAQLTGRTFGEDAVLLLQMEVPAAENWKAIGQARRAGARIVLNNAPAGAIPPEALRAIDVLIANEVEWSLIGRALGETADDPLTISRAAGLRYGLTALATLGARGAYLYAGDAALFAPPLDIAMADSTGAGDAFVGAFTAAFQNRLNWAACLAHGAVAGGLACEARGAQTSLPDAAAIAARLGEVGVKTVD